MNLRDADIQQAVKTAADAPGIPGLVVMVAGGNSNSDAYPFSPAFVPLAITVGSTTITDSRATFSNSSSRTEVWAPGSDVKSTGHRSDADAATLSDTSMACPHVSAALALILIAKPKARPDAVLAEMLEDRYDNAFASLKNGDIN